MNFKWAIILIVVSNACSTTTSPPYIQTVSGLIHPNPGELWLSHEHILVDFIGADSIDPLDWNDSMVISQMLPYLHSLNKYELGYFVDATPNYLGRDAQLLKNLSQLSGISIITNTGLYGAVSNKYIPFEAKAKSAQILAQEWINEFTTGIDNTQIKPGFIKISVNNSETLWEIDKKLIIAAALTHKETGLTIASHTGEAKGLWPQLNVLDSMGISADAFIWVHAQNESDPMNYVKAAKKGCWISIDGFGWDYDGNMKKLIYAKDHQILDKFLISHDAGWFDPQKDTQSIVPYTTIFDKLIPELIAIGFSQSEISGLLSENPLLAYSIQIRIANR